LDIEERILLAELNKIRLNRAKKADKDAARKTQSPPPNTGMPPFGMDGPPPDFFMTDDERAGLPPIESVEQPAQLTSEILQEREIVRILINYGDYLATWEGDGDIPVAGLLLGNISDIEFKDKAAAYILNVYREAAEKYEIPDTKQFYSNSDPAIADLAINCVASKYSLSENWNDDKRKIYVTQEYEHLKQLVVTAIYRIKKRKIEAEMHHIREEMKHEQDVANLEVLIFKYQKLKEAERLLGGFLGNTIVK
jgi:DNA primase